MSSDTLKPLQAKTRRRRTLKSFLSPKDLEKNGSDPSANGAAPNVGEDPRPGSKKTPYKFRHQFLSEVMKLLWTKREEMRCRRALKVYLEKVGSQPMVSRVAMRGERKGKSKRNSGAARTAFKGEGGFWHALLQWFVDEMENIDMRTDSYILLDKVREMRQFIIDESNGLSAEELNLPKLEPNNTGFHGLNRWRRIL